MTPTQLIEIDRRLTAAEAKLFRTLTAAMAPGAKPVVLTAAAQPAAPLRGLARTAAAIRRQIQGH